MPKPKMKADSISKPKKEMGYRSHVANEKNLVDGVASERRPSGYDLLTVDDDMRRDLKLADGRDIPPGWEPKWIRDDRYWSNKVPGNRYYEWRRDNPGGLMATVDGQPFSNGSDLVLCFVPPETMAKHKAAQDAEEREFFKRMEAEVKEDDFDKSNTAMLRRMKAANSRMHERSGAIGTASRTSGLDLQDAEMLEMRRGIDIDAEERKWAMGPRGVEYSEEQAERLLAQQQANRSSGRSYSLPPTVAPKNLMKT